MEIILIHLQMFKKWFVNISWSTTLQSRDFKLGCFGLAINMVLKYVGFKKTESNFGRVGEVSLFFLEPPTPTKCVFGNINNFILWDVRNESFCWEYGWN